MPWRQWIRTVEVEPSLYAADFSIIGGEDLGAQTRAAMKNLESALNAVGASWGDIVRRTIYTLAPTEVATISEAIESVTGSSEHPAQTIVGVTGLALPGLLIEIEAILGYNFSVAVWVGYIALFGTAIQTAWSLKKYPSPRRDRTSCSSGCSPPR